jgi:YidC/Oxa1 family membrane protein insertase
MYDRKTWIVVTVCSLLLAVNIYYQQQNTRIRQEQEQKQREAAEMAAKTPAGPAETPAEKPGSLVEVEPPAQVVEVESRLETSEAVFVFTNIGGGLKYAELKSQSPGIEGPVRLNRHGNHPVGAISDGVDRIESGNYTFVREASVEGKSVVFRGKLPSGVWAQKTWSLRETGNAGDPYMLDYKLQLENGTESTVNLDDFSVFLGTATPLDNVERSDQTGFVINDSRSFTYYSSTEFAKAWFGMRKARTQITEPT